jgi:hypothetical protein
LREIRLVYPETTEKQTCGESSFRAPVKIFAMTDNNHPNG